ncbi:hypothetical protein BU26DRAFT_508919 [Trematosphaeria pertusa]|uniref:Uncharacterized protein n=1 Tax=Trematosphaeria pertusa TaxID=390896 RepID=A0A6A6I3Y3_9PLEO|nr:uncharacterized protein BU26DRAFT_508919 [Trematosphaeria pertusa]KAF2244977.1 hypothetical protein BU26DRAFT_508919 [Trematosphaeria pertusa]
MCLSAQALRAGSPRHELFVNEPLEEAGGELHVSSVRELLGEGSAGSITALVGNFERRGSRYFQSFPRRHRDLRRRIWFEFIVCWPWKAESTIRRKRRLFLGRLLEPGQESHIRLEHALLEKGPWSIDGSEKRKEERLYICWEGAGMERTPHRPAGQKVPRQPPHRFLENAPEAAVTTSDRLGKMTKRPRTNSPYASREMHEWLFGTALRGITSLDQRAAATGAT